MVTTFYLSKSYLDRLHKFLLYHRCTSLVSLSTSKLRLVVDSSSICAALMVCLLVDSSAFLACITHLFQWLSGIVHSNISKPTVIHLDNMRLYSPSKAAYSQLPKHPQQPTAPPSPASQRRLQTAPSEWTPPRWWAHPPNRMGRCSCCRRSLTQQNAIGLGTGTVNEP